MPRTPIDYSNTIIYKLVCNNVEVTELYVGSTTNFRNRKNGHKSKCHNPNSSEYEFKVYQFIRANGGFQNWSMIVLERYQCSNKLECGKQERLWIETLQSQLNGTIPTRTKKESSKQYRVINKDYLHEQNRLYYLDNLEAKKLYRDNYRLANIELLKNKQICCCGDFYTYCHKSRHCKSQKHIDRINLFETVDSIISEYQSQQTL